MQNCMNLNNGWFFKPDFQESYPEQREFADFEKVHLPHTVKEIPYDCFDDKITCMVSTYARKILIPDGSSKRYFLVFDGVSLAFELYVNGRSVAVHEGPYSISFFEITDFVVPGENWIVCRVDSHESSEIPPNGSVVVDFLMYGGIYRDVKLYTQDFCAITNVKAGYELQAAENGMEGIVSFAPELFLDHAGEEGEAVIRVTVQREDQIVCSYERKILVAHGKSSVILEAEEIGQVELWNPGRPVLYQADFQMELCVGSQRAEDTFGCRIGFRTIHVEPDGFYINGKKRKLIGTNRHQSYPYVGYAFGKKAQVKDADLLMEYGMNIVRCSHYMQSDYFLDRADEIGLLIFEEIPGWGSIGDERYKQASLDNLVNMVNSHFNHASIVIWGTRLNETTDDDEFYTRTNMLCKELDPSRPTTGVRWDMHSHLLEDIYSFNDYHQQNLDQMVDGYRKGLLEPRIVTGRSDRVPYLVSEHTGVVMPTMPWDHEERQEAFALVQADAIRDALTNDGYLGALNWCAFDYNTHSDHDLHEKICYHGVFDMYRVPKPAAYVYKSQISPEKELVLEPCATLGRGVRSTITPFWVFTNCDYIDVKLSNDEMRRYFPAQRYAALVHPPILVEQNQEFWQVPWTGAVLIGYLDGREVIRREYPSNPHLCMEVHVDDEVLSNLYQDETRIECLYCDEKGNRMYSHIGAAMITVTGDIELVGPSIRSVMGGALAFWIRTKATGNSQEASVRIHSDRADLEDRIIKVELNAEGGEQ